MLTVERKKAEAFAPPGRAVVLAAALLIEIPVIAFLFDPLSINATDPDWLAVRNFLRALVAPALFFAVALAIVLWPSRERIRKLWTEAADHHRWRRFFFGNIALFMLLAPATLAFNSVNGAPPWGAFGVWLAASAVMSALLLLAAAPLRFWRTLIHREWPALLLAAFAAALVSAAAAFSQESWNGLARSTFEVSHFILSLYESDVVADPARRLLGAAGFEVNIAAACSGYEGVGMVIAFLSLYLWFFRDTLRFPNAWALLPIGVALIWLLNSLRIAALISIGAHVSPEIAVGGFHSQAGWLMFLLVTIGLMLVSQRMPVFAAHAGGRAASAPGVREAIALLGPFLAVTGAAVLIAAFSSGGDEFYVLRIVAGVAALFAFRRAYRLADWKPSWQAAAIGLIVGAFWIATDPARTTSGAADVSAESAANLWTAARIAGFVLVTPLVEELAFRGYLHRKLVAERFENVAQGAFTWRAFLVSSVLFGVIHERWLAGALAGAAFALALYRDGRIGGAIWAHLVANLAIAIYAVAFGAWGLL